MRRKKGSKGEKVSNRVKLADDFMEELRKTDIPIRLMTLDDPERCPVQMITGMMKSKQSEPSPDEVPKEYDDVGPEIRGFHGGPPFRDEGRTVPVLYVAGPLPSTPRARGVRERGCSLDLPSLARLDLRIWDIPAARQPVRYRSRGWRTTRAQPLGRYAQGGGHAFCFAGRY